MRGTLWIVVLRKVFCNTGFCIQKCYRLNRKKKNNKANFIAQDFVKQHALLNELNEIDEMYKQGDENANYRLKNLIMLI